MTHEMETSFFTRRMRSLPWITTLSHCMFTARPDLAPSLVAQFAQALSAMSYDNPSHRPVLEAEGLRRWVEPQLDGYGSLRDAAGRQGLLKRPVSVET